MITTSSPAEGRKPDRASEGPAGGASRREADIVVRMADKMREMAENGVAVTAESLAEHSDFTREEIKRHAADAADHAKSQRNRQLAA